VRYPEEMPPPFDLAVSNQGSNPSCVGHSGATLRQRLAFNQRIGKAFDGEWIYKKCKEIDGIPNTAGTYFRVGMKVLQKQGAKPIDGDNSYDYRIGAYAQADDLSFEGLKKLIAVYGSVLAGYRGTNEGWRDTIVRPPVAGEKIWGHAVILTGYLHDYIVIHNSWGEGRGKQGTFLAPANYLPFEAWVCLSDLPIIEGGLTGWAAKQYIADLSEPGSSTNPRITRGKTTANLRLRDSAGLSGNFIKLLPTGTEVEQINDEVISKDGHLWINIKVK
jgi:hypothetical protein